jgi:hypothetical protein
MKINGLEDGEGGCVCVSVRVVCVCVCVCGRLESFYEDTSEQAWSSSHLRLCVK